MTKKHDFDEDGNCFHCGFDGAEWHWWKTSTYEGRALAGAECEPEDSIQMPECIERKPLTIPNHAKLSIWRNGRWERIGGGV